MVWIEQQLILRDSRYFWLFSVGMNRVLQTFIVWLQLIFDGVERVFCYFNQSYVTIKRLCNRIHFYVIGFTGFNRNGNIATFVPAWFFSAPLNVKGIATRGHLMR